MKKMGSVILMRINFLLATHSLHSLHTFQKYYVIHKRKIHICISKKIAQRINCIQHYKTKDQDISTLGCGAGCGPDTNGDGKGDYNYGVSSGNTNIGNPMGSGVAATCTINKTVNRCFRIFVIHVVREWTSM